MKTPIQLESLKHVVQEYDFSGFPCVYFLLREGVVVYVGQSKSLNRRVPQHDDKDFDQVYYFKIGADENLNLVEASFIKHFSPEYNKIRVPEMSELEKQTVKRIFSDDYFPIASIRSPNDGEYCSIQVMEGEHTGKYGYYDDDDEPELIHECDFCQKMKKNKIVPDDGFFCEECVWAERPIIYLNGDRTHYYLMDLDDLRVVEQEESDYRLKKSHPEAFEKYQRDLAAWNALTEDERSKQTQEMYKNVWESMGVS